MNLPTGWRKLPKPARLAVAIGFILPTVLFLVVSAALLIYTFVPVSLAIQKLPKARQLTLLAHGIYDNPESWSDPLAKEIKKKTPLQETLAIDWSDYSRSVFRCSVNGLRLGRRIGEELAAQDSLQLLHLIGHSCGAFVVYGVCTAVKEKRPALEVQTTYLDPVSNYGGLFKDFGLNNFGSCADYSEAYIDTEDSVPGSNQKLPHAFTFDVTKARKRSGFEGNPHLWPVEYYRSRVEQGANLLLSSDNSLSGKYPPGQMETK